MKEKFWMVWNENGNQPRYKHTFRPHAEEEAARLAREHKGQTFIVLESICEVVSSDLIVTRHTDPLPF